MGAVVQFVSRAGVAARENLNAFVCLGSGCGLHQRWYVWPPIDIS